MHGFLPKRSSTLSLCNVATEHCCICWRCSVVCLCCRRHQEIRGCRAVAGASRQLPLHCPAGLRDKVVIVTVPCNSYLSGAVVNFHTKLKNTKVQIEGNHNAPHNLITQTSLLFRNKLTDSTSYFMRKGMLLLLSEVWPWRNIPNNYYAAETLQSSLVHVLASSVILVVTFLVCLTFLRPFRFCIVRLHLIVCFHFTVRVNTIVLMVMPL